MCTKCSVRLSQPVVDFLIDLGIWRNDALKVGEPMDRLQLSHTKCDVSGSVLLPMVEYLCRVYTDF